MDQDGGAPNSSRGACFRYSCIDQSGSTAPGSKPVLDTLVPFATAERQQGECSNAYPSPVEPNHVDDEGARVRVDGITQESEKVLGKRKPVDNPPSHPSKKANTEFSGSLHTPPPSASMASPPPAEAQMMSQIKPPSQPLTTTPIPSTTSATRPSASSTGPSDQRLGSKQINAFGTALGTHRERSHTVAPPISRTTQPPLTSESQRGTTFPGPSTTTTIGSSLSPATVEDPRTRATQAHVSDSLSAMPFSAYMTSRTMRFGESSLQPPPPLIPVRVVLPFTL